jgi:hypothetical protein
MVDEWVHCIGREFHFPMKIVDGWVGRFSDVLQTIVKEKV